MKFLYLKVVTRQSGPKQNEIAVKEAKAFPTRIVFEKSVKQVLQERRNRQ